jgi:hypothetical protein
MNETEVEGGVASELASLEHLAYVIYEFSSFSGGFLPQWVEYAGM